MVRAAAILSLVLGASLLFAYLNVIGKGPFASLEDRHLRELKDRLETPPAVEPVSFDGFAALPSRLSVAEYSGIERRAVSLEGWVRRIMRATDGDLHLEIYPRPRRPDFPRTVYATAEITPGWRSTGTGDGVDPATGWSFEHLNRVFRADHSDGGVRWDRGPAKVRITGWLLYDIGFDREVDKRGQRFDPRLSGWEIHPVTRIERWDDARDAWVEVAR
jgi:hypothetical protein